MKVLFVAGLMATVALAGCQSRLNPAHWSWFERSASEPTLAPKEGYPSDVDPRPRVSQVVSMQVDRTQGGAIVTAVGLPPTQAYWEAALIPTYKGDGGKVAAKDGVIQLEFLAVPPFQHRREGTRISRELSAGIFLSDQSLEGVREIRVVGQNNQRSSRR